MLENLEKHLFLLRIERVLLIKRSPLHLVNRSGPAGVASVVGVYKSAWPSRAAIGSLQYIAARANPTSRALSLAVTHCYRSAVPKHIVGSVVVANVEAIRAASRNACTSAIDTVLCT